MVLYHGTTGKRAERIFAEGKLKCIVDRHYTPTCSGNGYTEQGYVYLSNEILFSILFANCCNLEDHSEELYIFKLDVDDSLLEADYDEMRIQSCPDFIRKKYKNDLDYSLNELKSCRVNFDINLRNDKAFYMKINVNKINIKELITHSGCNLHDTQSNYSVEQKRFIESIQWERISTDI